MAASSSSCSSCPISSHCLPPPPSPGGGAPQAGRALADVGDGHAHEGGGELVQLLPWGHHVVVARVVDGQQHRQRSQRHRQEEHDAKGDDAHLRVPGNGNGRARGMGARGGLEAKQTARAAAGLAPSCRSTAEALANSARPTVSQRPPPRLTPMSASRPADRTSSSSVTLNTGSSQPQKRWWPCSFSCGGLRDTAGSSCSAGSQA